MSQTMCVVLSFSMVMKASSCRFRAIELNNMITRDKREKQETLDNLIT